MILAAGTRAIAYPLFFPRRCLTWGARPDEVSMKLPGDELLAGLVSGIKERAERPARVQP
jgi:hypothetical protein